MRALLELHDGWWVSPSAKDAKLAATKSHWQSQKLEYADEPRNHPRQIALTDPEPLGWRRNPKGEQLPDVATPWLSYAQQLHIPKKWKGRSIVLQLDYTRYHVTITVNGQTANQYLGGLEPHAIDITSYVTPGDKALLEVRVGNAGTSGHRPFDTADYTGNRLPTCAEIADNVIHPVIYGGVERRLGRAWLEALPRVRTAYVFANPKVSEHILEFTVAVRNDRPKPATVHVRSRADKRTLLDAKVTVPGGSQVTVKRRVYWPDAILWDIDNPHLYSVKTTVHKGKKRLDVHHDTFGMREFRIDGPNFYLNGKRIHLFNQSGHTSPDTDQMTLEQKVAYLRAWKEKGNINHIRLHARPQHKDWVIAADQVGLLVTTETALWTTNFHSFDWVGSEEACYENVRNHFFEALVRRDRNNPSVVLWSLSNEMSPITKFDLEIPKMAAMTRVFKRILAEVREEDDSRIVQMSSAMDFLGELAVYNLHYPKNWQAFPDYPHTAYWLDDSFLFPWYGPRRLEMPSWSWRRDKPLLFGEFTCVFGATPDSQASIVGDRAFEQKDFGTKLVQEKLWPLEIKSYRRLDVSGFCAWACMFHDFDDVERLLKRPHVAAHGHALRPVAVLCHSYRHDYMSGDDVAIALSVHNDERCTHQLELQWDVVQSKRTIWSETWPATSYRPADNRAFTTRFRAPEVKRPTKLYGRARLWADGELRDEWRHPITIYPRQLALKLPVHTVIYDPDDTLSKRFAELGIGRCRYAHTPEALANDSQARTVVVDFVASRLHYREWCQLRSTLTRFVYNGGNLILAHAPDAVRQELPVAIENGAGFANEPHNRLELTYAYNHAPMHPVTKGLKDDELCLWGEDYYVANETYEMPQEGNTLGLLLGGTAESGLVQTPLLELRHGHGSFLISSLNIISKLSQTPHTSKLLHAMCAYRPQHGGATVAMSVSADSQRVLGEVGAGMANGDVSSALKADIALIDGERLGKRSTTAITKALHKGQTVYLHGLDESQTSSLLQTLRLPGQVQPGHAAAGEFDTFCHRHPLTSGMSNNFLFWIVDKASVAPWTAAPLHPQPATALIRLPKKPTRSVWQLTRRGALTVYKVGPGTLVLDHLRWELPDFDEPERPRRYIGRLLTNLGVPLSKGASKRTTEEFETAEERRERGHF